MTLTDRGASKPRIAPFFKLYPSSTEESVEKELLRLREMGIRAVTVEWSSGNMTPIGFGEEFTRSIRLFGLVCKKTGMQFYIQDAAPFPTGSGGGVFLQKGMEKYGKLYLDERHLDIAGPIKEGAFRVDALLRVVNCIMLGDPARLDTSDRKLLGVAVCGVGEDRKLLDGTFQDVTSLVTRGILHITLPEGYWRIMVFFTTGKGSGRPGYMNLLSKDSVAVEIREVHSKIWSSLEGEPGTNWRGFFYDEPEIGNTGGKAVYDFHMLPGRRQKEPENVDVLPWSEEMPEELQKRVQDGHLNCSSWKLLLPYLFYDGNGMESAARYLFMDAATSLCARAYGRQVYDWCREHGTEYMGHALEDQNSHARLGCGPGHYFRFQYYQDRAGVDLLSGQIVPGADLESSDYGAVHADGAFYHYVLAKLASSAARIDPLQHGRSVCETFGLYGDVLDVRTRKFLTDHLLVNGISSFIWADTAERGLPARFYRMLLGYTDRMGGAVEQMESERTAAILYHAESEWSGQSQKTETAARELARHQISYDIIPDDVFRFPEKYAADFSEGLCIGNHHYQVLVIPGAEYLPEGISALLERAGEKVRFRIIAADRKPERICGTLAELSGAALEQIEEVPAAQLAEYISGITKGDFRIPAEENLSAGALLPWIRYLHLSGQDAKGKDQEIWLIHNEAPQAQGKLCMHLRPRSGALLRKGTLLLEDPMTGIRILPQDVRRSGDEITFQYDFGHFEMAAAVLAAELRGEDAVRQGMEKEIIVPAVNGEETSSMTEEYTFSCAAGGKRYILDLGEVSSACDVEVSGREAGCLVSAPYRMDISDLVQEGANTLKVRVYGRPDSDRSAEQMDAAYGFSAVPYMLAERSGISGPVRIHVF